MSFYVSQVPNRRSWLASVAENILASEIALLNHAILIALCCYTVHFAQARLAGQDREKFTRSL